MKCTICNKKLEDFENDFYYCYNCNALFKLKNYQLEHFKDVSNYQEAVNITENIEEINLSREETKDLNP